MLTALGSIIVHFDWSIDEPLGVVQYVEIASVTAPSTEDAIGKRGAGSSGSGASGSGSSGTAGSLGAGGTGIDVYVSTGTGSGKGVEVLSPSARAMLVAAMTSAMVTEVTPTTVDILGLFIPKTLPQVLLLRLDSN